MHRHRRIAPGQLDLGLVDGEVAMRDVLTKHLRKVRRQARLVPEMGVSHGAGRIDLASIDDRLDGFEIKSDRDDLRRLPNQVVAYGHVFDRLTLVTTERHLAAAERTVPRWWGLALIDSDQPSVDHVREAEDNPGCDPLWIARLLWRDELEVALAGGGGRRRRGSSAEMRQDVVLAMTADNLREYVRGCLKNRASWRAAG